MKTILLIISLVLTTFSSCKRFLDLKPDKRLTVPTSLKDLQALLDNKRIMNTSATSYDEASADNYQIPIANYNKMSENQRLTYIWENFTYKYGNDWANIYNVVNVANEVLVKIDKTQRMESNSHEWDNIKGSALFFRATSFLKGLWIFSKAYDPETADNEFGIILRLDPGYEQRSKRASLSQCYKKIVDDLLLSSSLLPEHPQHVMRPSKPAAYAMLSRAFLSMRKYDSAYKYSDLCLQLNHELLDYNKEDFSDLLFPFKPMNKEIIFYENIGVMYYRISPNEVLVDSSLVGTFKDGDLRREAFLLDASALYPGRIGYIYRGTYTGEFSTIFTGLTTAEMYLTRAECRARLGKLDGALSDLNFLLQNRFKLDNFSPLMNMDKENLLKAILEERRKELMFRGLRWMDIKRLNMEGRNIILKRIIMDSEFTLKPNENRYALPLPFDIVEMTGIPQNPI
jgi:tetratricopeptide (TPR) repeat protein